MTKNLALTGKFPDFKTKTLGALAGEGHGAQRDQSLTKKTRRPASELHYELLGQPATATCCR
jgi:hypothetical protein